MGKAEGFDFGHGGIPISITIASPLGSTPSGCPTRCVDSLSTSRRREYLDSAEQSRMRQMRYLPALALFSSWVK